MSIAYIKAISYYLPDNTLDNYSLSEDFPEWSADKISSKTGIYNRHIAAEDEFSSDMAISASKKLFSEYNISPLDIDFILLCTQSPDYFLPTTACIVQNKLGIPTTAGALDFNLGCSGYVYGLSLAKGLICAGIAKNILFITTETYSKYINKLDKSNRTIFGDAATATLITNNEDDLLAIGNFHLGTDGSGAENLIVKRGASKHAKQPEGENEVTRDSSGNEHYENNLFMNGPEILNFTIGAVPKLVNETLKVNYLTQGDIELFIFHQANKFMLDYLRKKIDIPEDKFLYHLKNCGNTVSSTIPIALKEAINQKRINRGINILLAGFGVGYSWGGVVLSTKHGSI